MSKELYEKIWRDHPVYRKYSPAVDGGVLEQFVDRCEPAENAVIADVGCGCGRSAPWLTRGGYFPYLVDFVRDAVDPEVRAEYGVYVRDVTEPLNLRFEWVFSTDLLEHLKPADVPAALDNMIACASVGCYLVACTTPDAYGPKLVGTPLHLTVRKSPWWRDQVQAACGRAGATLNGTWSTGSSVAFHVVTA